MSTLQDLIAQKEAIEREIKAAQEHSRAEAVAQVRALMAEHGLSLSDLNGRTSVRATSALKGGKAPVKYRNADTGESWSGRGLKPRWLTTALVAGKQVEDFAVA